MLATKTVTDLALYAFERFIDGYGKEYTAALHAGRVGTRPQIVTADFASHRVSKGQPRAKMMRGKEKKRKA